MAHSIPALDEEAMATARARQQDLTKPPGSLGRLEDLSVQIAGMTGESTPRLGSPVIVTMAGDHGVAAEGVSAFPQAVTAQMVANFAHGGAAVNALAGTVDAENLIVDMGVAADEYPGSDSVIRKRIGAGTDNIAAGPAMSREEAERAIQAGRDVVAEHAPDADVIGLGDMGIGNTTPSAAISAAITGADAEVVTGHGSGIDEEVFQQKVSVVRTALETNDPDPEDGIDVLRTVGGFEIGGLAGVALEAASRRIPVVIDGFITGAGALLASRIDERAVDYFLPSHSSVESGHAVQLEELGIDPLFDLEMRLGEGTGAALGIGVYKGACDTLREMATFEEAGVSN